MKKMKTLGPTKIKYLIIIFASVDMNYEMNTKELFFHNMIHDYELPKAELETLFNSISLQNILHFLFNE